MSTIFESLCEDITIERFFGICDNRSGERAYINTDPRQHSIWSATIQNKTRKQITFTALDKCIEIPRGDGKMSKRCEGVITVENTIIFLEVKERRDKASTWAKDAEALLKMTIENIEKRIDISLFENKYAAITNRLQRNQEKHSVRMKKFFEETGYILHINHRVAIE